MRFRWLAVLLVLVGGSLRAAPNAAWTQAVVPFRIAGNVYYVGSKDLAAYLIVTPAGNILINSNLVNSPEQIKTSIEKLGFRFSDTKILLISHAHFDHCAGSARIKALTGAQYMVMDADVPAIEDGGRSDFFYAHDSSMYYLPAHVDRVLHDGDTVKLGGTVLVAHLTAGHTKGSTTWTLRVPEGGHMVDVVIVGGPYMLDGYKLKDNPAYPTMAADFERTFATLAGLKCDVFLGAHGIYFGLDGKIARMQKGDAQAFVDPAGYKAFVAAAREDYLAEREKQLGSR